MEEIREPPFHIDDAAVRAPGLLPGLSKDPLVNVTALTVPDPPKLPPLFTTTLPAVPLAIKVPPLAPVLALEAIDPPVATNNEPALTVAPTKKDRNLHPDA